MDKFNQQLARLKEALAVAMDKDVANALGLSKASFSDRKKRGAFPDDKLLALIAKRPDLGIDYGYITRGIHETLGVTPRNITCSKDLASKVWRAAVLACAGVAEQRVLSWNNSSIARDDTIRYMQMAAKAEAKGLAAQIRDMESSVPANLLDELNRYGRRP